MPPTQRSGRIELLSDRDEADAVLVEHLHDPGEVEQRTGQAVDLVDHHAVDQAIADILQQLLQRWALHVGAGVAAIVVAIGRATQPSSVDLRV
jgi:hypothetical protein